MLYKTSLYFSSKDAMIKDFKLGILICFNLPITEHLASTPHIFPILIVQTIPQHCKDAMW
jgi:hypothetical protein